MLMSSIVVNVKCSTITAAALEKWFSSHPESYTSLREQDRARGG